MRICPVARELLTQIAAIGTMWRGGRGELRRQIKKVRQQINMDVPIRHFLATPIGCAGVVALAFFAGAEVGHVLSLNTEDQTFATFWPPAGLLLAALVMTGYRLWPAVLLGAYMANLASNVLRSEEHTS